MCVEVGVGGGVAGALTEPWFLSSDAVSEPSIWHLAMMDMMSGIEMYDALPSAMPT